MQDTDTLTATAVADPADPAEAERLREQAAADRDEAEAKRAEADTLVSTAKAQAERLVRDAETKARTLASEAAAADKRAETGEQRAILIGAARAQRETTVTRAEHALALAREYSEQTGTADGLDGRLSELDAERRQVEAALSAARQAGNVDEVEARRQRLTALAEVVTALTAQRDAARGRAQSIGEPGWGGELDKAMSAAKGAGARLESMLDELDPARIDRRRGQAVWQLAGGRPGFEPSEQALRAAAMTLLAAEQVPDILEGFREQAERARRNQPRSQSITRPDGSTATLVTVPKV